MSIFLYLLYVVVISIVLWVSMEFFYDGYWGRTILLLMVATWIAVRGVGWI